MSTTANPLPFSPLTNKGLADLDREARWLAVINLTQPDRMPGVPVAECHADALTAARYSMELHNAHMQRIDAERVQ